MSDGSVKLYSDIITACHQFVGSKLRADKKKFMIDNLI